MAFSDHFSTVAPDYERFRPRYPEGLFDFVAGVVERHDRAWDCGAGSGQGTRLLARRFDRVVATDASPQQLAAAGPDPGWDRVACAAERVALADRSVELATVAQALHWFTLEPFYAEVRRIVRPGGALVVWSYEMARVEGPADRPLQAFYHERMGPWWPCERSHVESGYADLPFPFDEEPAPEFEIVHELDREGMLGYVGTWSAVARCRRGEGADPVDELRADLEGLWPEGQVRRVRWPVHVRVGRVG